MANKPSRSFVKSKEKATLEQNNKMFVHPFALGNLLERDIRGLHIALLVCSLCLSGLLVSMFVCLIEAVLYLPAKLASLL